MTVCQFDKDATIRLDRAAKIAFPDGTVRAHGLRKECAAGRLEIIMIAGKEYTTLAAIDRMKELCRVSPKEPMQSGGKKAERPTGAFEAALNGSSKTDSDEFLLASIEASAAKLKNLSRNTLPKTRNRRARETGIPSR